MVERMPEHESGGDSGGGTERDFHEPERHEHERHIEPPDTGTTFPLDPGNYSLTERATGNQKQQESLLGLDYNEQFEKMKQDVEKWAKELHERVEALPKENTSPPLPPPVSRPKKSKACGTDNSQIITDSILAIASALIGGITGVAIYGVVRSISKSNVTACNEYTVYDINEERNQKLIHELIGMDPPKAFDPDITKPNFNTPRYPILRSDDLGSKKKIKYLE